eukprot:6490684-Amphidinium_carterae.2
MYALHVAIDGSKASTQTMLEEGMVSRAKALLLCCDAECRRGRGKQFTNHRKARGIAQSIEN